MEPEKISDSENGLWESCLELSKNGVKEFILIGMIPDGEHKGDTIIRSFSERVESILMMLEIAKIYAHKEIYDQMDVSH